MKTRKARRSVTGKHMLAEASLSIYEIIAIARRDPKKALRAAEKCTGTNCSWAAYDAAQVMLANRSMIEPTPASPRRGTSGR